MKSFIAITSEIKDNKLVKINTGLGLSLADNSGIETLKAVEFLFDLRRFKRKRKGLTFICYAFSIDFEFIFSSLKKGVKDRLFKSYKVRQTIDELETEIEDLETILYNAPKDSQDFEQADFEKYVNQLFLSELLEVKLGDYKIKLNNGKTLTITKNKKSIVIFDVFGFFRCSLLDAVKQWLKLDISFMKTAQNRSSLECFYISKLTDTLNKKLIDNDIVLQSWFGATAISSHVLSKSKAKSEYFSYRYWRQMSAELWKAHYQAYFGGRIEQFKIGTLKDIKVYDINSAYAYACLFLPVMRQKMIFSNAWKSEPFSFWFAEYDFSKLENPYFGMLPNREAKGNYTRYKLRGKGYFYQPEIAYILKHYPETIEVKQGFYLPYTQAEFTQAINDLYTLRNKCKQENHPLAKVLKLALAGIYGKFCQRQGKGYYYNFFYAGFITSLTRMMMLEATRGFEQETVCFLTDAIHTTATLNCEISSDIGAFSLKEYDKGTYFDAGIYTLTDKDGNKKDATKGFRTFDFDESLKTMQDSNSYAGLIEFFVTHNLHSFLPAQFKEYLGIHSTKKKYNPIDNDSRIFIGLNTDFFNSFMDSRIVKSYGNQESYPYKHKGLKDSDAGLDAITAQRI